MLTHRNGSPTAPKRAVVIGSGGFVGSTIVKELAKAKIPTLGLTRTDIDLLSPGAADALKARLLRDDTVVFVSAIAPAKACSCRIESQGSQGPVSGRVWRH